MAFQPLNFKVRGLCRKATVLIHSSLGFAVLFLLAAFADDVAITMIEGEDSEIPIQHCHAGDVALIHDQNGGTMITEKASLVLDDFSMLRDVTNYVTIRTVCQGLTNAPIHRVLILKRIPPPTIVRHRRRAMAPPPEPPIPWSLKMALPNAGNPNESYSDYTNRQNSGMRRSQ